jgi:hypothetical protein
MTAPTAAFAAMIDASTPLPFKRAAGSATDLPDLRSRPCSALDQAGHELLGKGVAVVWRRASVLVQGSKVYDGAVFRTRTKEDMRRLDDLAAKIAADAPPGKVGPAFPVPNLPLVSPADVGAPPVTGWTTSREFVEVVPRWCWPGWSVRRAASGEAPCGNECG